MEGQNLGFTGADCQRVYIGLDPLNHSLDLMNRILNAEGDGMGSERRYGEGEPE